MPDINVKAVMTLVDRMSRPLGRIHRSMQGLERTMQNMGGISSSSMNNLRTATSGAGAAMEKLRQDSETASRNINRSMNRAANDVGKVGAEADRSGAKIKSMGQGISDAGRSISTRVSLPAIGFLTVAGRQAVKFDDAMRSVAARAQLNLTNPKDLKMYEALTEKAKELGATTRFSASEAADGMGFLAQAGWRAQEVLDAMPGMLDLAAATSTNLAGASDIASNVMTAFGMDAAKAGKAAEVLALTTAKSNVNLIQLGESMKYAAPAAKAAGMSIEDTAAIIGILGNAGIQGSLAGTALNMSLTRLRAPNEEVQKGLAKIGLRTRGADGNFRGLVAIMKDLEAAQGRVSKQQFATSMRLIFGAEAASKIAAAMGQGTLKIEELSSALQTSNGGLKQMVDTMNQGAGGAMAALASAFEAFNVELMNAGLLDALIALARGAADMMRSFGKLPDGVKVATGVVVAFAAIAGPVLMSIGMMVNGVLGIGKAFAATSALVATSGRFIRAAMLATTIFSNATFVPALVAVKGAVLSVFAGLQTAALSAGATIMATPVGWLLAAVAAIGAAVYVIYDNWDGIVEWFTGKFDRVLSAFDKGLLSGIATLIAEFNPASLMMDLLGGLAGLISDTLADAFGIDLSGVARSVVDTFMTGLADAWSGVKSVVPDALLNLFGVAPSIESAVPKMPNWARDVINTQPQLVAVPANENSQAQPLATQGAAMGSAGNAIRAREQARGENTARALAQSPEIHGLIKVEFDNAPEGMKLRHLESEGIDLEVSTGNRRGIWT